MRYILTICILFIFNGLIFSQFTNPDCDRPADVPEFIIGDQNLNEGATNMCYDVTVNNFDNIGSFQFILSWNPSVLDYASFTDYSLLSQQIFVNDTQGADGILILVWSQFDSAENQSDGTAILEICFDVSGECGDMTDIQMIGGFNIPNPQVQYAIDETIPSDPGCLFNYPIHSIGNMNIQCPDLYAQVSACHTTGNDGSLTITPVQGVGPYTYTVNPGAMSGSIDIGNQAVLNGLSPDTYTVVVMDSVGDTFTDVIEVENSDPLIINLLSSMSPSCMASTNGNINVQAEGGESFGIFGYEYQWSNGQYTDNLVNLQAGIYNLTVSDLNGCTVTEEYDLTVSEIVIDTMLLLNDVCGSNQGAFSFAISGGTPDADGNYDVTIFNVPFVGLTNGEVIGGLAGGDYTIDVEDSVGCSTEITINVPGEQIDYTSTVDPLENISCFGECDGSFTLTINETGTFTFDPITNPVLGLQADVTTTPNSITATNLCGGIWLVSATENNSACPFSTTVTITEPDVLTLEVGQVEDNTLCDGSNGSIILVSSGGSDGEIYTWLPDVNDTDAYFGAAPGIYTITATDVNGCTASTTAEVMQLASAGEADINVLSGIGCNNSTQGELAAEVVGGDIANYTIAWNSISTSTPLGSGQTIQVNVGEYELILIDNISGCESRDTVELMGENDITFEVTGQDLQCFEGADGVVEVFNVTGGNGDYEVEWSGYQTTDLILTTAEAGLIEFVVRDGAGCSLPGSFELTQPNQLIPDFISQSPTCYGGSDGSITVSSSGGVASNGYTFDWPEGTMFDQDNVTEITVTDLPQGDYEVVITDDNGCMDSILIVLNAPDSLGLDQALSTITPPECVGTCDGFVNLVVQGGTPDSGLVPYSILWEDGNQSLQRSDLCPELYLVTITDGLGCTQELELDFFLPGDTLMISIDEFLTTSVGCSGDEGASVVLVTEGGAGDPDNFTYQWTDNISDTTFADDVPVGDYSIMVTDSVGCTASTTYTVTASAELMVNLFDAPTVQCAGDSICFVPAIAAGGSGPPYFYQVQNQPPVLPIDSCITLFAGVYDLTVRDLDGCSFDTIIEVLEPSITSVDIGGDMTVELGDTDAIIQADYFSDFQIDSIVWSGVDTINCLDVECTEVNIGFTQDQVVSVIATDVNGCTAVDQIQITVDEVRNVFLPTVFMPDIETERVFMVHLGQGAEVINYLAIFDRWGNEMYRAENVAADETGQFGWTGRFGSNDAIEGVYVYIVEVLFSDGEVRRFAKDLTLLR